MRQLKSAKQAEPAELHSKIPCNVPREVGRVPHGGDAVLHGGRFRSGAHEVGGDGVVWTYLHERRQEQGEVRWQDGAEARWQEQAVARWQERDQVWREHLHDAHDSEGSSL